MTLEDERKQSGGYDRYMRAGGKRGGVLGSEVPFGGEARW